MFFSIIIPTCNRPQLLDKCLTKLDYRLQKFDANAYEVIVTDDSSSDATELFLKSQYTWIKWLKGPARGPAANRNNGASFAKGEWLIFLDDDCEPDDTILNGYLAAIRENAKVEVFEGKITSSKEIDSPLFTAPVNNEGGYLWSCNFMIRRSLFFSIGMFDEVYPYPNLEDNDLRTRLVNAGYKIVFVSTASVYHPPRKIASPFRLALYHESWLYYHAKFGQKKGLNDLLVTIIKNRGAKISHSRFSVHTLIAFMNALVECLLTTYFFFYKYETHQKHI